MAGFDAGAGSFDVATCSYHAMNHLTDETALSSCLASVAAALRPSGLLAFDLRTARGLEGWNRIKITDRREYAVISRGFLNRPAGRAWKALTGFVRLDSGHYERFEELLDNTVFGVSAVLARLNDARIQPGQHCPAVRLHQ